MKNKLMLIVVMLVLMSVLTACVSNVDTDSRPENGDIPNTEGEVTPPSGDNEDVEIMPPEPDHGSEEDSEAEKPNEEAVKPEVPKPTYELDTWIIVTSTKVNVREHPSGSSRVLGTLRRGEGLGLIMRDVKWYKVYYKGKQAYISASYVREVSTQKSKNNNIERIISEGKRLLGYPYIWGSQRYHWGNGILNKNFRMGEFDCSALMQYMFYKGARINLDVTTRTQVLQGKVAKGTLVRGDLMFFTNEYRRYKQGIDKVGHVALYLGDNYILHTAKDYALIEEISSDRWDNYLVSKRFL